MLVHIAPFLFVLSVALFVGLTRGLYHGPLSELAMKIVPQVKFIFHLQWIVYLVAITVMLFRSRDWAWTEKQWRINAGGVLLVSYVLGYFLHGVELHSYYTTLGTLNIPYVFPFHSNLLIIFIFITTNLLLFKSLDHQKVAWNAVSTILPNGEELEYIRTEFDRLSTIIINERLFTQSDLTLSVVAEKTGIKERTVSNVVNTVADKGFNEFINELRVREAQKLLRDTSKSVKEIQFEVGFKSKTTFFHSFKKVTNQTPKDYRDHIIS
jgi:AraC-like DNA-binding protein